MELLKTPLVELLKELDRREREARDQARRCRNRDWRNLAARHDEEASALSEFREWLTRKESEAANVQTAPTAVISSALVSLRLTLTEAETLIGLLRSEANNIADIDCDTYSKILAKAEIAQERAQANGGHERSDAARPSDSPD